MPTNYVISSTCYIVSVLLDGLDGEAARKYRQCNYALIFHRKIFQQKQNKEENRMIFIVFLCFVSLGIRFPFSLPYLLSLINFERDRKMEIGKWGGWKTLGVVFWSIFLSMAGTKFGAMLDQLTDRCGTMGLLVTLSYFYPKYMFWFQLSMVIYGLFQNDLIMVWELCKKRVSFWENFAYLTRYCVTRKQ